MCNVLYASTVLICYSFSTPALLENKNGKQTKTAKTPLMDFANECGINWATEDTLLMHAKISQTINVFPLGIAGIHIGDGLRCGGI